MRLAAAILVTLCVASALEAYHGWRGEGGVLCAGEWCGCKAGPKGCQRPCQGCCGGDEGMCFSGMDPTTKAPNGPSRPAR